MLKFNYGLLVNEVNINDIKTLFMVLIINNSISKYNAGIS